MTKKTTAWVHHQRFASDGNYEGELGTAYSITPEEENKGDERVSKLWECVREVTGINVTRAKKPMGFL